MEVVVEMEVEVVEVTRKSLPSLSWEAAMPAIKTAKTNTLISRKG